ncbi:glyoxalase [Streptococcus cuniculipharyngis]|nr:glyoxalase [Streptococcus cuniculipharyngis]
MNNEFKIMLYVKDVDAEKAFWQQLGFIIENEQEVLGYPTFDMRVSEQSNCSFTVYSLSFIERYSPSIATNQPNLLFTSSDIETIYQKVKKITNQVSDLNPLPFKNFNFQSPSGHFYTIRES